LPEEIEKAKATLQRIAEERTHLTKLAAGIAWNTPVELPSHYLTARIKAREDERLVTAIKCPSTGATLKSPTAILEAFYFFYSRLFQAEKCDETTHNRLLAK
jgi:hypothetical protein